MCVSHVNKGKVWKNPRWRMEMMWWRKNMIRVFTLIRRCFIYKHVLLGPCAKTRPVNIFCIQQTIIPKRKNKKRRLWSHGMKTSTWTRGLHVLDGSIIVWRLWSHGIKCPRLHVYCFEAPESKSKFSYHATTISSFCFFSLVLSSVVCRNFDSCCKIC
jgi:hypothetical protein